MKSRPCKYAHDREQLVELLQAYRLATSVRVYPTIWRVFLLLTSRVWREEDDRIWQTESGHLTAFAMLWRRQPTSSYLVLDCFVHPDFATPELVDSVWQWGDERAQAIVAEQKMPLTLYANSYSAVAPSVGYLNQAGFVPVVTNPDEHNVYMAASLQAELPEPVLPSGYVIRPLRDVAELEAYQSLYGFAAVNPHHQQELMASDEYAYLVVVTDAGELAAYCECSVWRAEWQDNQPKIGWIDYIQTKPERQKQGLGRAILLAGLYQLHQWGAETAMLVTVSTNMPALHLYEKTGFKRVTVTEAPGYKKPLSN
jgi:ribosomal protein S18 acetylase RimI-like enzyme